MTATNAPFGLKSARKLGANPNSGGFNTYRIASLTTASMYQGQPVGFTAAGVIDILSSAGYQTGAGYTGVFVGCQYTDPNTGQLGQRKFWPGGTSATDAVAFVEDDPDSTFYVQANTSLSSVDIGTVVGFTTASYTSGTSTFGQSLGVLNQGALGTSGGMLRILGVAKIPDNVINDAYPIVEVVPANSGFRTTAGI